MNAITISNLTKTYTAGKKQVEALAGIDLTIASGEVFGFLGPNGAGKSTTIKILMGLVTASAGAAKILGHNISLPAARRMVGYLPENPSFYDYLSAPEYLEFTGRAFDIERRILAPRITALLDRLDLTKAGKRPIRSFSKGMVQRLGIAQVLVHDPEVCILDEPVSGLDPIGRVLVREIIGELKQAGKCVFFSSHITSDVESICDRVGIIIDGRLKAVESVEEIQRRGITGYRVRYRAGTEKDQREETVATKNLPAFMQNAVGNGWEIALIEPQKKNLEQFFLEVVHRIQQ